MKTKVVAILQSNYIPWKGYFDLINRCDEFVLLDDVQYTRRDWRNRNKIKTKDGLKWLTIPVEVKGNYNQKINEVKISDPSWADKHWNTLQHQYRKSARFHEMSSLICGWYESLEKFEYLSDINKYLILEICRTLKIKTTITSSTQYKSDIDRSNRLALICEQANATTYLSGPSAQAYLDEDIFNEVGIKVEWMDYSNFITYDQLHSNFDHGVTILDVLFNTGNEAPLYVFQS